MTTAPTATLIEAITYIWHDDYRVVTSGPLTDAQAAVVKVAAESVDETACAFGDDCAHLNPSIGFALAGDENETSSFTPFYVTDEATPRTVCEDCADEHGMLA